MAKLSQKKSKSNN